MTEAGGTRIEGLQGHPVIYQLVRFRMVIVLALLMVIAQVLTDGLFFQAANLVNVARQISFEALIAFGMTLVIITGGIDLSVGSLVALTGVVGALAMGPVHDLPMGLGIVAGLAAAVAVGGASGAASGLVVTRFGIPPFIVTLAGMLIARGLAFIVCNGEPIYEPLPEGLRELGRGFVLQGVIGDILPVPVLIMLTGFLLFHLLLGSTTLGRCIVAVGSNEEAARLAGINVRGVKMLVYVLTGLLCGVVGVLNDAKLLAGDPKVAEMWELHVIAAVVVGGTSLFGGRGSIPGTLIGALIIGVLNNSLNLMQVQHFWQNVVTGSVILLAALLDVAISRIGRS